MLASLILFAGLLTAPAQAYQEYVALGDSWSADVSVLHITDEHAPRGCAQSTYNYPKQVAAALGVPVFRDATCGGATTAHMTAAQDVNHVKRLFDGVNPPQFDRLSPTTDLVTLGIGGNDARLATAAAECLNLLPAPLGRPCRPKWVSGGVDRMSRAILAAEPKVAKVVDGIRRRSPRAHILLVDYLAGLPQKGGCYPYVQAHNRDLEWLGDKLEELNAMLARVAAAKGVELVDTYSTSVGHDVCKRPGVKWVEGYLPLSTDPLGPAIPLHPNRRGADHQAVRVLAALEPSR
ncbi:SGNH/GDSL hydrolase family protein [Nonomuraea sp. NPDC059194]|uniref:SGNH/GDSL hydrolase family protein n=1 Tax=Nonomuraea sp. NPDC059194 TaxID=3346764 RepID=UPI00369E59DA